MATATTTPQIDLSTIPQEQLDQIRMQIRKELSEANAIDIVKLKDELRKANDDGFTKAIEEFEATERKRRKPLSNEELQKLLSKEYITFTIEIQDQSDKKHKFTLRELGQNHERELYKLVKETLADVAREYSGFSFKDIKGDIFEKIMGMMDLFEPVQTVLTKCCTMCLNPGNKVDHITSEWVSENLSNFRIMTILMAQVEVNKMRDFFSLLFSGFQSTGEIDQASTQQ